MKKTMLTITGLLLLGICLTACSGNDRSPVVPGDLFTDVPRDYFAGEEIDTVYRAGIMEACRTNPPMFCPDAPVTRQETAKILLKAIEGNEYLPLDAVGVFDDVPIENRYSAWIGEAVRRDIISKCSDNLFCPNAPVTRGEICAFLLKTIDGSNFLPPEATGIFSDVPAENPEARWIEEVTNRIEIIVAACGTNPPSFCPDEPTTRTRMAILVARLFGLKTD